MIIADKPKIREFVPRTRIVRDKDRTAVTIAAGVICTDGVMLCADTEHTGDIKFERGKVRRENVDFFGDWALTGTGTSSYIAMASDMVEEGLYANRDELSKMDSTERSYLFKEILRQKIRTLNEHIRACHQPDNWPSTVELLLAFNCVGSETAALVHIDQTGAVETIREDGIFIGNGASIAYGFARVLWDEPLPMELMRYLIMFAFFQAKKSAAGCGGGTDIYRLPRNAPRTVTLFDDEKMAESVEKAMRLILLGARDVRITQEQWKAKIEGLAKLAEQIRDAATNEARNREWVIEVFKNMVRQPDL